MHNNALRAFQRFIQGLDFGTSSCMVFETWQVFYNRQSDCTINLSILQFWGPGNFELFLLSTAMHQSKYLSPLITYTQQFLSDRDGQLFVIPFAKSATTGQHSPVSIALLVYQMIFSKMYRTTQDTPFCKWMIAYLYIVVLINLI